MEAKTLLGELKGWMEKAYTFTTSLATSRTWCSLGYSGDLKQADIAKYFDRSDLNNTYVLRLKETDLRKKQPVLYIQAEINFIYGLHKSAITRHKTRLQAYRDDCAMKHYHTRSAIEMGEGKFYSARDRAEDPN